MMKSKVSLIKSKHNEQKEDEYVKKIHLKIYTNWAEVR